MEYSGKMEPVATKILLTKLQKKKVGICILTTDWSSQIKRLMRNINVGRSKRGLKPIKHRYDTWHMVKSVTKELFVTSKLKKCRTLACWIKSMHNMCLFVSLHARAMPIFSARWCWASPSMSAGSSLPREQTLQEMPAWGPVGNIGRNVRVNSRFYLRVWIFKLRLAFSYLRTCCWAQYHKTKFYCCCPWILMKNFCNLLPVIQYCFWF